MIPLIEANWPILLVALLIGVAVAWFVFVATRKTSVVSESKDVLDEGAERAQRNQALIDAKVTPEAAAPTMAAPDVVPVSAAAVTPAVPELVEVAPASPASVADDLTRIKGLGPKLAATLADLGVTRFEQIANWSDADVAGIDARLGRFQGRIERDQWVEQARLISSGDESGFHDKFGSTG